MEILLETKALVEQVGGFLSKLVDYGFVFVKPTVSHSCYGIYVSLDRQVVVKRPILIGADNIPAHAIPTVLVKLPLEGKDRDGEYGNVHDDGFCYVAIQPLADLTRQQEARDALVSQKCVSCDMGVRNLGHYHGKPVAIDW